MDSIISKMKGAIPERASRATQLVDSQRQQFVMKHALAIWLIFTACAFAQRPQLTWDGFVDGSATLYIQGRNVDAQGRTTGSVDRPRARFLQPLPAGPQTVDVQVRRGAGSVSVVEHPNRQNDFSAVVQIDNPSGGGQNYSLEFYWDPNVQAARGRGRDDLGRTRGRTAQGRGSQGRGSQDRGSQDGRSQNGDYGGANRVTWSGSVDSETLILFRGRQAFTTAVRGQRTTQEQTQFTAPLPRQDVSVRLEDTRGRGQVELLEQPSVDNNYTAKVRVLDDGTGAGTYSFALSWDDSARGGNYDNRGRNNRSGNMNEGILTPGGRGGANNSQNSQSTNYSGGNIVRWSGRVDNRVQVTVQGNRVYSQRLEGAEILDEHIDMGSAVPARAFGNIEVRKVRGRGDVRIVEQSVDRLVFEVRDSEGGADTYDVELTWR